MKKLIYRTLVLILAVSSFASMDAQSTCILVDGKWVLPDGVTPCPNAVVTAVPFLRIVSDARSGAMGDAGIAISPDANSVHFNDSKLAYATEDLGLSATYTPWLKALGLTDVYLAYLSGHYKLDDLQSVGVGLRYFSLGEITFTDANGEILNTGKPREYEIKGSYARKLTDRLSVGLGGKFIVSNLAAGQAVAGQIIEVGTAGAADISATYRQPIEMNGKDSELVVGVAVTNIGSKITYTNAANNEKDFIPTNLGIGAAWTFDDVNKLLVPTPCLGGDCDTAGEVGVPDYKEQSPIEGIFSSFGDHSEGLSGEFSELTLSMGMEYWYDKQFAVRAGYYRETQTNGNRQFFTVGLGMKYNIFGLNFSYLVPTTNQRNPLDNTLRFSLLFDFGAFAVEE